MAVHAKCFYNPSVGHASERVPDSLAAVTMICTVASKQTMQYPEWGIKHSMTNPGSDPRCRHCEKGRRLEVEILRGR